MSALSSTLLKTPDFDNPARLLDPGAQPLETGVVRLPSGVLHVAARTDMPMCKGRMLEWWFRFAPDTQQCAWWHPLDHVSSAWIETSSSTHVESTHIVKKRLGGGQALTTHIHFVDPGELFASDTVDDARERGDVSGLVVARVGIGEEPPRDEKGRPNSGRMRTSPATRRTAWCFAAVSGSAPGPDCPPKRSCRRSPTRSA